MGDLGRRGGRGLWDHDGLGRDGGARVALPAVRLWYGRCDRSGLVAWAEIPSWGQGLATPEFLESAKQQLRELIRQNFNHPSICFWGVGNETSGPASESVIEALTEVVREEDPSRLSTYASNHDDADPKNWHTDVVAFNRYFGWYGGQALSTSAPWLDGPARTSPGAGGGGGRTRQGRGPAGGHPEEYQNLYHEAYWAALKDRPRVWAKLVWCLHDFASDGRNEGDDAGRNDKGLVTYDRSVMKDALYSTRPTGAARVLHIASCRFTERTDPVTEVKVYSNAPEVTLEVKDVPWHRGRPEGRAAVPLGGVRLSRAKPGVRAGAFWRVRRDQFVCWT